MFTQTYYKLVPPCKDCPNRKLGCHSVCQKFKAFEHEKLLDSIERVKKNEGLNGHPVRLSAIIG